MIKQEELDSIFNSLEDLQKRDLREDYLKLKSSGELLFTKYVLDTIKECVKNSDRTIEMATLKLCEETGEVAEAVSSLSKICKENNYKNKNGADVIEECVDTMICAMSIIQFINPDIRESDLKEVLMKKLLKWKKLYIQEEENGEQEFIL